MNTDTIQCTHCNKQMHPLETFPGTRCVDCHEARMSGVTVTAEELTALFGGRR